MKNFQELQSIQSELLNRIGFRITPPAVHRRIEFYALLIPNNVFSKQYGGGKVQLSLKHYSFAILEISGKLSEISLQQLFFAQVRTILLPDTVDVSATEKWY